MTISILNRLVIVAAVFTAVPAIGAPRNNQAEVCALGARILAEQARGGVKIFDGEGVGPAKLIQDAARRSQPPPAKAELKLLEPAPENLFVRCPKLMKRLPEGARMATPEDMAAVKTSLRGSLLIGLIHAPRITPDGRTALAFASVRCPGLCGNGGLTAYRRVGGRWVADRVFFRFMS
jgi:hypothetical protein